MTNVRLVGAVAISTISLVAVMWYLRRKNPPKKRTGKLDKSTNAKIKEKDSRNNLRHISSQPLIAEANAEPISNVSDTTSSKTTEDGQGEIIIQEVNQLTSSKIDRLLHQDGNCLDANFEKSHKDKDLDSLQDDDLFGKPSLQDDLILAESTNNLNKASHDGVKKEDDGNDKAYQNLNLTGDVSETIISENVSVLNEAMTASRMDEVSFITKLENEKNGQEIVQEQDALSVSTIVPLLESTNLDITCSQSCDNDSNTDDVIKPETSIKLESSICESSQSLSSKDKSELSHSVMNNSVLDNNSCSRQRNDSNCSSHSASHMDDKISETSSDRTASPFKDRNSVSPSKDSHHAVLENGVQNSDISNCDSVSVCLFLFLTCNMATKFPHIDRIFCYNCLIPVHKC